MLLWLTATLAAPPAEAPVTATPWVRSPTIEMTACWSEKLFVGTIVRVDSHWVPDETAPQTAILSDVTFQVERDLKTDAGTKVVVTLEGGTIGDRTIASTNEGPEPRRGLRYLIATSPMGVDTKTVKKNTDVVIGWQPVPPDEPLPELEVLKASLLAGCEG